MGHIIDFSKSQSIKNDDINKDAWLLDLEDIEKDTGKLLRKKRMKDVNAKSDKHPFEKGNVLYSKLRPYLNKVIIADEDGVCTSEILAFDFTPIFNQYAQVYLMSPFFVEHAMSDAYGVKMPRLGSKQGNAALMPIPPITEQIRIVDRIDAITPLVLRYSDFEINLNRLNSSITDILKKSILQEAIQGKLVPQIESEGTAEELLAEIQSEKMRLVKEGKLKKSAIANESRIFRGDDNKYYEQIGSKTIDIDEQIPFNIPNSWRWIRLGYIIDFSASASVRVINIEPDSWILDLEDIEKDSGRLLQRKRMSEIDVKSDKHRFSTGNILYSKLRPYLNKVLIADMNGYCTSEILAFDFGKINTEYALAYLRSPFFVEYAMSDAYGVKMPRLGSKQGNNALMPIPPLDEQYRIVNKIRQLDNHFI